MSARLSKGSNKSEDDVFDGQDDFSKKLPERNPIPSEENQVPHVTIGKANKQKSLVNSFTNNSKLFADDPVYKEIQKAAEQSESVVAARLSRAEFKNSSAFLGRQGVKSMSFRRSKHVRIGSGRSTNFKSIKASPVKKEDAEKLKAVEKRIIENSKDRQPVEDTSIMADNELIAKYVYQLRSEEHGDFLKQKFKEYSCILSKGYTFDNPTSTKPCQDCIGVAEWKDYEVVVVSDGHGKTGEEVAWQVSNFLPGRILKHIIEKLKELEKSGHTPEKLFDLITAKEDIEDIFYECDETVIWSDELVNFRWVKIVSGKYKGLMGQVCSTNIDANEVLPTTLEGPDEQIPVCIFMNGERKFREKGKLGRYQKGWTPPNRQIELPIEQHYVSRKHLLCERDFYGGGTCLAFIRNAKFNLFKFATAGDSRVLYVPPSGIEINDDLAALTVRGSKYSPRTRFGASCFCGSTARDPNPALLSIEHNIHDETEYNRLCTEHDGCFILGDGISSEAMEGYFYSNALFPYTGGLTPTRGFGDRLYYGSGYTCKPEVSGVYNIEKGSIIIGGSDGVFDDAVWGPEMTGLVHKVKQLQKQALSPEEIIIAIQEETAKRCNEWDLFRVDDISLFGLNV